ncbi:hypothetical protein SLS64_006285 [Diaporthe eres]
MFSRVILRRNDPASGRSSPDDIENQPLSPRGDPSDSLEPEMTERQQGGFSRLGIRRPSVPSRFRFSSSTQATSANGTEWPGTRTARASRSNTHPVPRPSSSHYPEEEDDEDLERQPGPRDSTLPSRYSIIVDLPSTRLHLPMLQRTWTQGSNGPPTSRPLPHEIHPALRPSPDEVCRPTGPALPTVTVTEPAPVARPTGGEAGQLFGEIGRPHLALSLTKNINNSEFTVLLILIILFATIFFCQGLIRLCLLILRPKRSSDEERRNALRQMYGPGGYAIPRQPIRVVLARDEEAAGIESETTKMNPPAYGLWRESVRVDPNRIYWERNTEVPAVPEEQHEMARAGSSADDDDSSDDASTSGDEGSSSRPRGQRRPPSYASEDGVAYVIEAQPRSIAPTAEVPLPLHPSEAGRVAAAPGF